MIVKVTLKFGEVINHITINSTFKQSFHRLSQLLFIIHCMIIFLGHQFDYPGPSIVKLVT